MTKAAFTLPNSFDDSCTLNLSDEARNAILAGKLKLTVEQLGGRPTISRFEARIDARQGNIRIGVGGTDAKINIGRATGTYEINLWRDASLEVGDDTTCNRARFICDDSSIKIGNDCMFSDEIIVQSADQHGIIDLKSKQIVNDRKKSIILGDHVWIGRRANILYGADIGSGSIVGFGSLVNRKFEKHSLIAGVPAKVIKEDMTWSRSPQTFDQYSRSVL